MPDFLSFEIMLLILVLTIVGGSVFFGLIRGFRRSLYRLIMTVAGLVLALLFLPMTMNFVVNFDMGNINTALGWFSLEPMFEEGQTLIYWVTGLINDFLGDWGERLPSMAALVAALPQVIIGAFVFFALNGVIYTVLGIIYALTAGIVDSRERGRKRRSGKLVGALIGLVNGVVIAFLALAPIFGVGYLFQPIVQGDNFRQLVDDMEGPMGDIIGDNWTLLEDFVNYDGFLLRVMGMGNVRLDLRFMEFITTATLVDADGEPIPDAEGNEQTINLFSLRDVFVVADHALFFVNNIERIVAIDDYDEEFIEELSDNLIGIIDTLFASDLLRPLIGDMVVYLSDEEQRVAFIESIAPEDGVLREIIETAIEYLFGHEDADVDFVASEMSGLVRFLVDFAAEHLLPLMTDLDFDGISTDIFTDSELLTRLRDASAALLGSEEGLVNQMLNVGVGFLRDLVTDMIDTDGDEVEAMQIFMRAIVDAILPSDLDNNELREQLAEDLPDLIDFFLTAGEEIMGIFESIGGEDIDNPIDFIRTFIEGFIGVIEMTMYEWVDDGSGNLVKVPLQDAESAAPFRLFDNLFAAIYEADFLGGLVGDGDAIMEIFVEIFNNALFYEDIDVQANLRGINTNLRDLFDFFYYHADGVAGLLNISPENGDPGGDLATNVEFMNTFIDAAVGFVTYVLDDANGRAPRILVEGLFNALSGRINSVFAGVDPEVMGIMMLIIPDGGNIELDRVLDMLRFSQTIINVAVEGGADYIQENFEYILDNSAEKLLDILSEMDGERFTSDFIDAINDVDNLTAADVADVLRDNDELQAILEEVPVLSAIAGFFGSAEIIDIILPDSLDIISETIGERFFGEEFDPDDTDQAQTTRALLNGILMFMANPTA